MATGDDQVGLALDELELRIGRAREELDAVLADEVRRGRVLRLPDGSFALVPTAFAPATLAALRGLSGPDGVVEARAGEAASRGGDVSKRPLAEVAAEVEAQEPEGSTRPSPSELLKTPGAFLYRTDLRQLGLERRAVDAAFRACPVIVLPGYSRPMIRVEAYLALLEGSTYCDRCGDKVRPGRRG